MWRAALQGAADLSNLVQVKLNQIIVGQVIIDPGVVSVNDQDLPGEVIWVISLQNLFCFSKALQSIFILPLQVAEISLHGKERGLVLVVSVGNPESQSLEEVSCIYLVSDFKVPGEVALEGLQLLLQMQGAAKRGKNETPFGLNEFPLYATILGQ